jgi:hypothetical protein
VEARRSKPLANSSTANTTPAIGVLNAPATPAAPPAISRVRGCGPPRRRAVKVNTRAATICTVGPSRPIDRPAASSAKATSILKPAVLSETRESEAPRRASSEAAITWGMPLPPDSGATLPVIHTISGRTIGGSSSTASGQRCVQSACRAPARSHSLANSTASTPPATAAAMITSSRQARRPRRRMRRI